MNTYPPPEKIRLHRKSCMLELHFSGKEYHLSAEYLRVYSPSAEVKGHGPGEEVLQLNKQNVAITGIEPQGNYAVKLIFSDKHDSGIYSWGYLRELCENMDAYREDYMQRVALHEERVAREKEQTDTSAVKWVNPE